MSIVPQDPDSKTPPPRELLERLASALPHEPFCELRMSRDKRCQCSNRDDAVRIAAQIASDHAREQAADVLEIAAQAWPDAYASSVSDWLDGLAASMRGARG